MPRGREPEGGTALTNAERQARYRARRSMSPLPVTIKQPRPPRRSRTKRWNHALAEMIAVQAECAAWFEALPASLCDSATAAMLQEMIDLDLDTIAAVQPPLGYGCD
jgi:hypothetical protein